MLKTINGSVFLGVFILFTTIMLYSCKNSTDKAPSVAYINIDLEAVRSEIELFSIDTTKTLTELNKFLTGKDSSFYNIYFESVLGVPISNLSDTDKSKFLNGFLADYRINRIKHEVDSVYMDFVPQLKDFKKAFTYLKHYFPEKTTPRLYTYISEYSLQKFVFEAVEGEDGLAVGLDMYLGQDYPYQKYVNPNNATSFSIYLTRNYDRDFIVSSSMEAIVDDLLLDVKKGETLLDKMLYNGRKLYMLDKLLPWIDDRIIMQYTDEQWQWCEENQVEMWAFFFKEELFYSTDINKITKLVSPSPHSSGMPQEAPGQTANYMGWKIIKAYMERYPEKTLKDLVTLGDSQKILVDSKFKPKRK